MNLPAVFTLSLAIGTLSAYLAYRRGHNPYIWFFVGFIFGLLGVFAIFFAPLSKTRRQKSARQLNEPEPYIDGPIDRFWYYLNKERKQQGPMSHNALSQAWKKGEIAHSTLVWHEDLPNW